MVTSLACPFVLRKQALQSVLFFKDQNKIPWLYWETSSTALIISKVNAFWVLLAILVIIKNCSLDTYELCRVFIWIWCIYK